MLVCTNDRDAESACCADAGGEGVSEAVAAWLRDRDAFWSRVRVAETTCLGLCGADGAAVAIHPRGRWYSDVRPSDVPDLLRAEFGPEASLLGVAPDGEDADASRDGKGEDASEDGVDAD